MTELHQRRGHRQLRTGRLSLSHQFYLITFATHQRRPLFACSAAAFATSRAIEDKRLWRRSLLSAWVLMPDHWHGLIELGEGESLSRLVQRLKSNTARAVRQSDALQLPIWAKGFHDHALRSDESLSAAASYIIENPVRAGLVASTGDYAFWNSRWL